LNQGDEKKKAKRRKGKPIKKERKAGDPRKRGTTTVLD